MTNVLPKVLLTLAMTTSIAWGNGDNNGFTVDFSQCTEYVGVGPVDLTRASALVPSVFSTLSTGSETGGLVVRATSCAGVKVNSGPSVPTNISQIGVEIAAPDGTGDINNYTLIYVSNNAQLVKAFNEAGVPAMIDPDLTYQFTYDLTGKAGSIYVEAEGEGVPPYFIYGTETDPTVPGFDFKANWWYAKSDEKVKQASDFPNIAFGTSSAGLYTSKNSMLGQLIGGNSDTDFHFLPVRGVYPAAHMIVTVTKK